MRKLRKNLTTIDINWILFEMEYDEYQREDVREITFFVEEPQHNKL